MAGRADSSIYSRGTFPAERDKWRIWGRMLIGLRFTIVVVFWINTPGYSLMCPAILSNTPFTVLMSYGSAFFGIWQTALLTQDNSMACTILSKRIIWTHTLYWVWKLIRSIAPSVFGTNVRRTFLFLNCRLAVHSLLFV